MTFTDALANPANSGCLPEHQFVMISQALAALTNVSSVSSMACRVSSVMSVPRAVDDRLASSHSTVHRGLFLCERL
jgi:hypothetical protein